MFYEQLNRHSVLQSQRWIGRKIMFRRKRANLQAFNSHCYFHLGWSPLRVTRCSTSQKFVHNFLISTLIVFWTSAGHPERSPSPVLAKNFFTAILTGHLNERAIVIRDIWIYQRRNFVHNVFKSTFIFNLSAASVSCSLGTQYQVLASHLTSRDFISNVVLRPNFDCANSAWVLSIVTK